MKIVMGLDPGSHKTGFGVIEVGCDTKLLDTGVIDISRSLDFSRKLIYLQGAIQDLLERCQPDRVVVEKVFLGKNVDSAFKLGHVRGVCLAQVARENKILREYASRRVKKLVTGHGGASKSHVQWVVRQVLGISRELKEDASDALALALCDMYIEQIDQVQAIT